MLSENFENPTVEGEENERERYSVDELRKSAGEGKEDKPESEEKRETLRTILNLAGIVAGSVALDKFGNFAKAAEAWGREEKKAKSEESEKKDEDDNENEKEYRVFYMDDYAKPIAREMDFSSENPVKISRDTIREAQVYWMVKYMDNEGLRESLKDAHERMQKWVPALDVIFKSGGSKEIVDELVKIREKDSPKTSEDWNKIINSKPGLKEIADYPEKEEVVPNQYKYIAIPETHWEKATSPKGAGGYYQFMPGTAKEEGLEVNSKVDERNDELKGAGACARYMRKQYDATGDWNKALASYNGFGSFYKSQGKDLSYEEFIEKHMSERIDDLKEEIKNNAYIRRKVPKRKGYYYFKRKYKVAVAELRKINGKKSTQLKKGERIKVPLRGKKHREYVYNKDVKGYKENLNYVPKVNAVLELIEQGMV